MQHALTGEQIQAWLCAAPVVLVMAPLGSAVLRRVDQEWMLRAIVVINIGQLAYFNLFRPTLEKTLWSVSLTVLLLVVFVRIMGRVGVRREANRHAVERPGAL